MRSSTAAGMREAPYAFEAAEVVDALGSSVATGLSAAEARRRLNEFGLNEIPPEAPVPFYKLVAKQFSDLLVIILLVAAVLSFLLALFEQDAQDRLTAFMEPAVILLILVANASVGVIQEQNAERAIQALRAYEAVECSVLRDGHIRVVPAVELVPGDIIVLTVGCKVPADSRVVVVQSSVLNVDQAILTGECDSVGKDAAVIAQAPQKQQKTVVTQDKTNMLFSGTLVTRGRAIAVVTSTGLETAFGKIHGDISGKNRSDSAAEAEDKTPLKEKLDEFGVQLTKLIGFICIVVWVINIHHFGDPSRGGWIRGALYYFKIAVALAVAAVPEGLPAVVTTCLALGTRAMAREGAIVRSLPSVETLGCTTVICADKTGTLTTNRMAVQRIIIATAAPKILQNARQVEGGEPEINGGGVISFIELEVAGDDFSPQGVIKDSRTGTVVQQPALKHPSLADVACVSALCNEAQIYWEGKHRRFERTGEPTEAALRVLVEKIGVPSPEEAAKCPNPFAEIAKGASPEDVSRAARFCSDYWEDEYELETVLEFTRQRKSMSVICVPGASGSSLSSKKTASGVGKTSGNGNIPRVLFVKGAPESVLKRCTRIRLDSGGTASLNDATRLNILDLVNEMGNRSYRCVALAQGDAPPKGTVDLANAANFEAVEQNLTLIGLACMVDPPRPQVSAAVSQCQNAGIRIIVVTGDNQATAEAVCEAVGLLRSPSTLPKNQPVPVDFVNEYRRSGLSITGEEWMQMNDIQQIEVLSRVVVIARVEPEHKLRLVRQLRARGEVVAMTGDGVNDAPALMYADIGIAMGSGTAVAREASDMVLADDNFATIVSAVRQGRTIFANTKQFIRYLISSNIGEVACIFLGAALGIPEALIPVQLLWVNFVTDGLPATALGFNPPDPLTMTQMPRSRNEQIVSRWTAIRYAVVGTYVGVAVVWGFVWWYLYCESGPQISWEELTNWETCFSIEESADDAASALLNGAEAVPLAKRSLHDCTVFLAGPNGKLRHPQTVALSILVTIEMFNAMNSVTENQSLLKVPFWINRQLVGAIALSFLLHFAILYIPWLSNIFSVEPIGKEEWWAIFWFSFPVIPIDEFLKFITRRRLSSCVPPPGGINVEQRRDSRVSSVEEGNLMKGDESPRPHYLAKKHSQLRSRDASAAISGRGSGSAAKEV